MIRFHLRAVPAAVALILALADSVAAQLTFQGLPWGAPAHEVAERIRAAGYAPRGVDQWGDHVFRTPDGGSLVAWMSPAGLVAVELEWTDEPARFPARFSAMADSLQALYGTPANQDEEMRAWRDDEGSVRVTLETRLDSVLLLYHSSLDKMDEIYRRDSLMTAMRERADTAGAGVWQSVGYEDFRETYVDTARFVVLGSRLYGARMRDRWAFPERLDNGLLYDERVADVELDCARGRSRLLRATPLYHRVATATTEVPAGERRWAEPPSGGFDARGIQGACQALERQRQ